MPNCNICKKPVTSGVVTHNECFDTLVSVVRCKDCKYYSDGAASNIFKCNNIRVCGSGGSMEPDDYCSYGKLKNKIRGENTMKQFNGKIALGGLYINGTSTILPTRPWSPYCTINGESGNILDFRNLDKGASDTIIIADTPADVMAQLNWLHFTDEDKTIFVCDRNILCGVSWDTLNKLGFVEGKKVTIDGKDYLCRLLTGGSTWREDDEFEEGGLPLDNEWDRYITGEGGFDGFPTLVDADKDWNTNFAEQIKTTHNQLCNWVGCFSWCQEASEKYRAGRALRGSSSARNWLSSPSSYADPNCGFRPALIPLSSDTLNSETTDN